MHLTPASVWVVFGGAGTTYEGRYETRQRSRQVQERAIQRDHDQPVEPAAANEFVCRKKLVYLLIMQKESSH